MHLALTLVNGCVTMYTLRVKRKPSKHALQEMLFFRATPELAQRLNELAKTDDRPRSWVIRQLLVKALESQREKVTA
jgi:hypothetical protein